MNTAARRLPQPARSIYSVFEGPEDDCSSEEDNVAPKIAWLDPPKQQQQQQQQQQYGGSPAVQDLELGSTEESVDRTSHHVSRPGRMDRRAKRSAFTFPGSSRHYAYVSVADREPSDEGQRDSPSHGDESPDSIMLQNSLLPRAPSRDPGLASPKPSPVSQSLRQRVKQATHRPFANIEPKQRALWMWVNVQDPDRFLQDVYDYHSGKGAYCILLAKVINLFTIGFVICFSTFLLGCIDYSRLTRSARIQDALVGHCVARFTGAQTLALILIISAYGWRVLGFYMDIRSLLDLKAFYEHLLYVSDSEIQSTPWPEIVKRIQAIKDENPAIASSSFSSEGTGQAGMKLDAHDIANRIMRSENYLIALFNKDILNVQVPDWLPIPLFKGRSLLTRGLEWNLAFCLLGFLLDSRGRVRTQFVQIEYREKLAQGLRRRFYFMALLNLLFAPMLVVYMLLYTFLRYFEEYHKNPSSFGGRQYTNLALWKFREFNELPHAFRRRIQNSYPLAQAYIDQFPKEKTVLVARVVAFVAGSFTAVLLLLSVIHPELALTLEITPGRSVLFYLGICGTILAVARGLMPDEKTVWDHEDLIRGVIEHTHYLPSNWQDQLHSDQVRQEFGRLYQLKIVNFFDEIISVLLTPIVLWWSLPKSSEHIIDFFREFTVHVDGLGHVCSFAVFDFERHGDTTFGIVKEHDTTKDDVSDGDTESVNDDDDSSDRSLNAQSNGRQVRKRKMMSNGGKMEQSIINFKQQYPEWTPQNPAASLYLDKISGHIDGREYIPQNEQYNPHSLDSRTSLSQRAPAVSRMNASQHPHLNSLSGLVGTRMSATIYNSFGPPGIADSMFLTNTGMNGGTAALVEYGKRTKRLASRDKVFQGSGKSSNRQRDDAKLRDHKVRQSRDAPTPKQQQAQRNLPQPISVDKDRPERVHERASAEAGDVDADVFTYDMGRDTEAQSPTEVDANDPFQEQTVVGILNSIYERGTQLRPSG